MPLIINGTPLTSDPLFTNRANKMSRFESFVILKSKPIFQSGRFGQVYQ